jgi:hypothetical protein
MSAGGRERCATWAVRGKRDARVGERELGRIRPNRGGRNFLFFSISISLFLFP